MGDEKSLPNDDEELKEKRKECGGRRSRGWKVSSLVSGIAGRLCDQQVRRKEEREAAGAV